jgi:1-acyl-sn-glycerol-3-phosphate acyltransferase
MWHGWRVLRAAGPPARARVTQEWGRSLCELVAIRVERVGPAPPAGSLIVANHRSYADVPAIASCGPVTFLAKSEVATWPVLGPAATRGGTVYVHRDDAQSGAVALRKLRELARDGVTSVVFPEGTTRAAPGIGAFQAGAFRLAASAGLPVVPVAVEYARVEDAWIEPGDASFVPHFLRCFARQEVPVRLVFGPPLVGRDANALRAEAERWIETHLSAPVEEPARAPAAVPV